jgi:hypothetical protein
MTNQPKPPLPDDLNDNEKLLLKIAEQFDGEEISIVISICLTILENAVWSTSAGNVNKNYIISVLKKAINDLGEK